MEASAPTAIAAQTVLTSLRSPTFIWILGLTLT
jgi:hypothetical protein